MLETSGTSIHGIVKRTGIARNTVRKILRGEENESRYVLTVGKPSTVEPYRALVEEKLGKGLRLKRIYREIKEENGFAGSYSALKRFARRLSRENPTAYIRFETLPGEQTQNDWSGFEVEFENGKRNCNLSNFVLCCCRKMHGTWYERGTLPNLIDSHKKAFKKFEGVTIDIVYDNQKSVVAYRFRKEIVLNGKFRKFAEYYGFNTVLCTPYKPNSKGKIERPFPYIDDDFVKGRIFKNVDDLNARYEQWLDEIANKRVHGTTGKVPDEQFELEKLRLRPLPEKEYEFFELVARKVATDCLISVEGSRYSVPWKHAGTSVTVKNYPNHFEVYSATEKIAEHKKMVEKHQMVIVREHYEGLRQRRKPARISTMQAKFRMLSESHGEEYFAGLVKHHKACISIVGPKFLRLFENYPPEVLREIFSMCVEHGIYDFTQLREYLHRMPTVVTAAPSGCVHHSNIEPRDLGVYALAGGCHGNC
ncbi:MAG: IS21 family transposase [Candidatus Coatesbacteria bacterium]